MLSNFIEYTYVMRFNAFNSWQNEATLKWALPGQQEVTYKCSPGRDIVYKDQFTTTSSSNGDNPVRVFAVDADGRELLINGKPSFLVKLEPSPGVNDDSQIQQLVISKTG